MKKILSLLLVFSLLISPMKVAFAGPLEFIQKEAKPICCFLAGLAAGWFISFFIIA